MNFSSSLVLVMILHLILFFPNFKIYKERKVTIPRKSLQLDSIKLKFIKKKKDKRYKRRTTQKIDFNMLKYIPTKKSDPKVNSRKGDASRSSEIQEAFDRIEERLAYPSVLISTGVTGTIKAKIYFDGKGNYLETLSKFEGINYLKVLVARATRMAFEKKLVSKRKDNDNFYIECFFDFRLVTNTNQVRGSQIKSNFLYFYRQGYGGQRVIDYLNKTVTGVFNVFSLIPHLPKTERVKKELKKELESYRSDPAWN